MISPYRRRPRDRPRRILGESLGSRRRFRTLAPAKVRRARWRGGENRGCAVAQYGAGRTEQLFGEDGAHAVATQLERGGGEARPSQSG
jgi:hypothetical protein